MRGVTGSTWVGEAACAKLVLLLLLLVGAANLWAEEFQAPIIITKGGTYAGNYRSDDSEVPAILVNTSETVELAGCHVVSSGIGVKAFGGSRLYIHHSVFTGQTPTGNQQWGRALDDYHPQDLTFVFNTVTHTGGLQIDHGDANTKFAVIKYNVFQNTDQRKADGAYGEHRASILFNSVVPIRGEIAFNQFTNELGESAVEDNINFGNSGGSEASPFLIQDNYIHGAYPASVNEKTYTGSGITVEGTGANSPWTVSQHVQILRNQVVSTCNAGINVNDGHHIAVRDNRIISSGRFPDGVSSPLFWGGCAIWNGSNHDGTLFHDIQMVGNNLGYRRPGLNVPYPDRQDYVVVPGSPISVQPGENVSLPNPITLETEAQEWPRWQQKLADAGVVVGASGSVKKTGAGKMSDLFLKTLLADGVVKRAEATLVPLTGGVSSEIYLVRDGDERFVVKRALAKLNVADEWFADVGRNAYEVEYIRTAGGLVPGAVPTLRAESPEHGYFAMEYLEGDFANWKTLLLGGTVVEGHAREAGRVLGTIHRKTWGDAAVKARFDTTDSFRQLRTDPYLLTTGRRHPDLEHFFVQETERLEGNLRCLVHGDFSPKNLLVSGERLVVLDCEVAWYGDPVFDVGFLLNHLFLKALHLPAHRAQFFRLARTFWATYRRELGHARADEVEQTLPRLLLMLMLARVDGKSPAEYLKDNEAGKAAIREFVKVHLGQPPGTLEALVTLWQKKLAA